jgi:hypothetical protein
MLEQKDLLPGDIVFFLNSLNGADHVGICKNVHNGCAYITHAVKEKYNCLITTKIQPDILPGKSYRVFRHNNPDLAYKSAKRISQWAKLAIKYDDRKALKYYSLEDLAGHAHPKTGISRHLQFTKNEYYKSIYRSIKYASRNNISPVRPKNNNAAARGFICSEAVILAYQSTELADYVIDITKHKTNIPWISDKYSDINLVNEYSPSPQYLAYRKRLNQVDEFKELPSPDKKIAQEKDQIYYPSIAAWNKEKYGNIEDFFNHSFTSSIPLDAKTTSSSVLMRQLQLDKINWQDCGYLQVQPYNHSVEQIKQWKESVASIFEQAKTYKKKNIAIIKQRSQSLSKLDEETPINKRREHFSYDCSITPPALTFLSRQKSPSIEFADFLEAIENVSPNLLSECLETEKRVEIEEYFKKIPL